MINWLKTKFNIKEKKDLFLLLWQFVKFGLVGISNTAVNFAIYYLFLWINPELYLLGSVLGTIISILNAFIWNDLLVFKGNEKDFKSILKRLLKTFISYGATGLLSNILLYLEVNFLNVSKAYAPVINLLVTIPLNFLINKFWTFKKRD